MGLMVVFGRKRDKDEMGHHKPVESGYPVWPGEDMEMRRRRSFMPGDDENDMEMRRRRRMEATWPLGDMDEDMEMRRRRRSFMPGDDEDDMEMRRRRRSSYDNHYPSDPNEEMRRRRMMDEGREIGFGHPHPLEDMRAEMHEMRKTLDGIKEKGYASVKKLAPNLEGVLEDASKVLEHHPQTWDMYMQRKDYRGIAKMEGKELLDALEAGKSPKEIRKELVHTIAALLQMVQ